MSNEQWLKSQCNRYVNGECHTSICYRRAGHVSGPPKHDSATCEAHELLQELSNKTEDTKRLDWLEAQQAADPDPTLPAPTFRESIDMVMKAETKNEHENDS